MTTRIDATNAHWMLAAALTGQPILDTLIREHQERGEKREPKPKPAGRAVAPGDHATLYEALTGVTPTRPDGDVHGRLLRALVG